MTTVTEIQGRPAPSGAIDGGDRGRPALPGPGSPIGPRTGRGRADDRRIAVGAMLAAGGFLAAAAVAAVGPPPAGGAASPWLALHLALAGAAATAISGVMPFFVGALAAAPPADARLRGLAVALVAFGAIGVAGRGIVPGATWLPPLGGATFLAGIFVTALVTWDAGRRGLMARRPAVLIAYGLALGNVAIGALLGTLLVAGWTPALEAWDRLRPAHAWLNLVGFVSLIVAGTLLHLLPTVLGTRIVGRPTSVVEVLGIGVGAPVVFAGLATGLGQLVTLGALATLAGAAAVLGEAALVVRARGRWTTDAGWHLLSGGALVAATAWFVAGVGLAATRAIEAGATGNAWSTPLVGAPLVTGWVVQVLVGSWTHLLPAIGPGGPVGHARRRRVLGRLSIPRLVALNAGTALLAVGWPAGIEPLAIGGLALLGGALATSLVLAGFALRPGEPG